MFLQTQRELALGSRFKALSEHCYAIANAAYRAVGIEMDSHWFPVLRYLQVKGPGTVTQIAQAIGQTHSAVSQLATRLHRAGWIVRRADRADARRSVLDLSADGLQRLDRMGPIWRAVRRATNALIASLPGDFTQVLGRLESELAGRTVLDAILAEHARLVDARPKLEPYRREWREHFHRINAEWLERYWSLEAIDKRLLGNPEKYVIAAGGAIFFAVVDGEVIGTCAMLREAPGVYAVSKMGVETGWRGIGAGRLLIDGVIAEFHKRRGKTLLLESNAKLKPALALYESAGFVHQPAMRPGSHYQRSDVYMIYDAKRGERKRVPAVRKRTRA